MDDDLWQTLLREALTCLDESRGYRGRGRQAVTLASPSAASRTRTMAVLAPLGGVDADRGRRHRGERRAVGRSRQGSRHSVEATHRIGWRNSHRYSVTGRHRPGHGEQYARHPRRGRQRAPDEREDVGLQTISTGYKIAVKNLKAENSANSSKARHHET